MHRIRIIRNHGELLRAVQKETLRLIDQQEKLIDGLETNKISLGEETRDFSALRRNLENERSKVENLTMTVAVVGTMKAGKSTLLNAIMGDEILPSRETGMTAVPVRISHAAGLRQPELYLHGNTSFNRAWKALAAKLREIEREKGDVSHVLKLVGEKDAEALRHALLDPGEFSFRDKVVGRKEVRHCLQLLNDLLRLCGHSEVNVESPLSAISTFEDLPELQVEFSRFTAGDSSLGIGRLAFIDTPGPDEAAQHHLKEIVNQQLSQASAIILVLNFTQLNTQADADLRKQVTQLVMDHPDQIHIVVNRFDQRDHNSMSEEQLRSHVTDRLFPDAELPTDRVLPVSSRKSLLAQQALAALKDCGKLPARDESPWVESFGWSIMGEDWEEDISDVRKVERRALKGMENSRFTTVTKGIVERAFEHAAVSCLKSALQKIEDFSRDGSNCHDAVRVTKAALAADLQKLNEAAKSIAGWLSELENIQDASQQFIQETMRSFRRKVMAEKGALLLRLKLSDWSNDGLVVDRQEQKSIMHRSMAELWQQARDWLRRVGDKKFQTQTELLIEADEAIAKVTEYASHECDELIKLLNKLAKDEEEQLYERINFTFLPIRQQLMGLLSGPDFRLEIQLPEFRPTGKLGDDMKKNRLVKKGQRVSSRFEPVKLFWLISIPWWQTRVEVKETIYVLDVGGLESRLHDHVTQWLDKACSGFENEATADASDYYKKIGQKLRLYRDAFHQQEASTQDDIEKKQSRASGLNHLDALRKDIYETASACLNGMHEPAARS